MEKNNFFNKLVDTLNNDIQQAELKKIIELGGKGYIRYLKDIKKENLELFNEIEESAFISSYIPFELLHEKELYEYLHIFKKYENIKPLIK